MFEKYLFLNDRKAQIPLCMWERRICKSKAIAATSSEKVSSQEYLSLKRNPRELAAGM